MTDPHGAIGFAEKVLELLDEARYTSTYKFAVLLALVDLCLEQTQTSGAPPEMLTTRQIADKVTEIYWSHAMPFARPSPIVLRQNVRGQAEIVSEIVDFRERRVPDATTSRWDARRLAPRDYDQLIRRVEWKLIQMPLPRLQMMGNSSRAFIYEIHWDEGTRRRDVHAYQTGESTTFDNRVLLRPGVGGYLVQLNGLLRPLIQRRWAAMVADLNRFEDARLETFLFGASRAQTAAIRAGLWTMQDRRCFYCDEEVHEVSRTCVDHFIPWSRYPDDRLDNLVVTDVRCNAAKSNSLAAAQHLRRWARRFVEKSVENARLAEVAQRTNWERHPDLNLNVARAIYLRLPDDARLWMREKEFAPVDPGEIRAALS